MQACARHAGIAMRSNSVYSVRKLYVHGLYAARPRRLAALAKVKNIPSGTAARASHVRPLGDVWAGSCTCTDTLLDLARLPVSRGIGEYQLPDLVVNPASRIIFGSVSRVRMLSPCRSLVSIVSAFRAITITRPRTTQYGGSFSIRWEYFEIRRIESLYLKVYLLIAYLRDLIVESTYITSGCNNALDFISSILQLDPCTIIMNIIFIREIGI